MSKEGTLVTVGILVAISPFIGLPYSWLAWILPVLGGITVLVGYVIRKDIIAERSEPTRVSYEAQAPQVT